MSDKMYTYSVTTAAKTFSMRAPVYLYYFGFEGEFRSKANDYLTLNVSLPGNIFILLKSV